MIDEPLPAIHSEMTDVQLRAVNWDDGALLVLAGPGSGKTRVLTGRIARLLDSFQNERFRILALTFTNKAATEMKNRVSKLAPGLSERVNIGTFHRFCTQMLRQHGVHIGIKPDFAIYGQTKDREAVLADALRGANERSADYEGLRILPLIDNLKAHLLDPDEAERQLAQSNGVAHEHAGRIAHVYRLYEQELRRANALDFNSLIFEAFRLFGHSALAKHCQTVYRYWLIDEFQDTNAGQYALLRRMAGQSFRNIFAVADDDQTIFEWNGASVRRIEDLVKDFACEVVQIPTNFRCPPRIVEAANRLIVYNAVHRRKQPATAGRDDFPVSVGEQIRCRDFRTETEEVAGIAEEIMCLDPASRGQTAVLARNRSLLDAMLRKLAEGGVPAAIAMRRDEFLTPEMRWLVACLKQIKRPLDKRNLAVLVDAFNGFASSPLDCDGVISQSETQETAYLDVWIAAVRGVATKPPVATAVERIADLSAGSIKLRDALEQLLHCFEGEDRNENLTDDLNAWRRIQHAIRDAEGFPSLERLLHELQLHSKGPPPPLGAVTLTTIHGAKGQEFDIVYLIGLAEEILPSWQSLQKGDGSSALQEERRGCFVAVTRTRKRLTLSWARSYRGWPKEPSRFLKEMGCI